MGDSNSWKPGTRPGSRPSPAKPAADSSTAPAPDPRGNTAGRIVHDERGNAVWDWLKDTARTAIDSTSRLLRKLEVPELKMEDTQSQELRLESDRDLGGGYDPYGGGSGPTSTRTSGGARSASGRAAGGTSGAAKNAGGGYDPYGKSVTQKPPRKP